MFDLILKTPIGNIGICLENDKIKLIRFLEQTIVPLPTVKQSPVVKKLAKTIASYFANPSCLKDLPVSMHGTPFQKRVWQELRKIPLGKVRTYGELAKKLDTSARAIGMACRSNPIPLVIPCHRVVAANGLGGFNGFVQGSMVAIKQWLLVHENVLICEEA